MKVITLPNAVVLILAIIGGVLEYLNQQTFGLPPQWYAAVKYGILLVTALGVTIPVGRQLGVDIVNALHLSPAVVVLLTLVAFALAAATSTFQIDQTWKGIILGFVAFITAIFGPYDAAAVQLKPVPSVLS